jgi:hypothetical protein
VTGPRCSHFRSATGIYNLAAVFLYGHHFTSSSRFVNTLQPVYAAEAGVDKRSSRSFGKTTDEGLNPSPGSSALFAWRGRARGKPSDLQNHSVPKAPAGSTPASPSPRKTR